MHLYICWSFSNYRNCCFVFGGFSLEEIVFKIEDVYENIIYRYTFVPNS